MRTGTTDVKGTVVLLCSSLRSAVVSILVLLFAAAASAQTLPYDLQVESFAVPERGLFDDFDDGVLDSSWTGVIGTVTESGGTLSLSSPGVGGFLPPGVDDSSSVLSGMGTGLDGFGNFTASSVWAPVAPGATESINLSIGSVDSGTGNVSQLSIGLSRTSQAVADVLGGDAGLAISMLNVVRDSGPGNILSFSRSSIPILDADVTGAIVLSLIFDDALDTMTPAVSLDGGTTTLTPFAAEPWAFGGGGFSLSGGSTVPEPGTGLLLGLGVALSAVAVGRRGRM